jgi:hypothetical protein
MPSCSEESHEWNTLANPIRNTLSILQYWLEKHLDELAQFKARLCGLRSQKKVYQPSDQFSFFAKSDDA